MQGLSDRLGCLLLTESSLEPCELHLSRHTQMAEVRQYRVSQEPVDVGHHRRPRFPQAGFPPAYGSDIHPKQAGNEASFETGEVAGRSEAGREFPTGRFAGLGIIARTLEGKLQKVHTSAG